MFIQRLAKKLQVFLSRCFRPRSSWTTSSRSRYSSRPLSIEEQRKLEEAADRVFTVMDEIFENHREPWMWVPRRPLKQRK